MRLLIAETLFSLILFPATYRARRALQRWIRVPSTTTVGDGPAPAVSVIVPARNEERSIEACVQSLLDQDYPEDKLQVIVIDDESIDATPAILSDMAAKDSRLLVLKGSPLPDGWTGKSWALNQGVSKARPDLAWFLFTDADTIHAPETLASTIAFATAHQLDALSLGTGQHLVSWSERALLPVIIGITMLTNGTFEEVNDPGRPEIAKAVGQFILVREDAYRSLGGHAAIRGEVVEDFEFARRAKRLGYRYILADGRHLVRTRGYRSIGEIWEGFNKNALREARRLPGGSIVPLVGLPVIAVGPHLLSLVALRRFLRARRPADALLLLLSGLQVFDLLDAARCCALALGAPARYGLLQPFATLFIWAVLANATAKRLTKRGASWKGRTLAV